MAKPSISLFLIIMNITIAAATTFEIKEQQYQNDTHNITFLYTGVGLLHSAVSLTQHVLQHKPHLIIQVGIAGSFNSDAVRIGDVVAVQSDRVADMGVNENGTWTDVFDMGFAKDDEAPYASSILPNENLMSINTLKLQEVQGVTVNEITTAADRIQIVKAKYNAQVESMEGASLHYVCRLTNVPFIQLRGISNKVGVRDKTQWQIQAAIANVNATAALLLKQL